ncbi:hypothetical protein H0H93_014864 [Arthromyces matolae]|nr:hypothetical protein H0H93_014864 [Arthromyces matolae]
MKAFHGLFQTISTFSILAFAVEATPLPALNNAQVFPRNVETNPSTAIRDHDSMHSTHFSNPFDSLGIFPRMDPFIKEEPIEHLDHIPLASSGWTSSYPPPATTEQHNPGVSQHSIPSVEATLRDLDAKAEKAFHDKQILQFEYFRGRIGTYFPILAKDGIQRQNLRVLVPINMQKLAEEMYDRLCKRWRNRDPKDTVCIETVVQTTHSLTPLLQFSTNANQWNPMVDPNLLPPKLLSDGLLQPEGDTRPTFQLQQLLDLGNAFINRATTTHSTSNDHGQQNDIYTMIILGYQLIFVAAVTNLENSTGDGRNPSIWLLYLIRDAEYAVGTSNYVKARLDKFDKHLTALLTHHKIQPQKESNWYITSTGSSTRQAELKKRLEQERPSRSGWV